MNIRFRVHDRRAFPNGIVLDINGQPALDALAPMLRETGGEPVADLPVKSPRGVTYANFWLTDPTVAGVTAELARIADVADKHTAREELAIDDARIRREAVATRAANLRGQGQGQGGNPDPGPPEQAGASATANPAGRGRV